MPKGIARLACWHKILRRIIGAIAIYVIRYERSFARPGTRQPAHQFAAPMAGMLTGSNLVKKHLAMKEHQSTLHGQRMIRRPKHEIRQLSLGKGLPNTLQMATLAQPPTLIHRLATLRTWLSAQFPYGPSRMSCRVCRVCECRLTRLAAPLLNTLGPSAVWAGVLRMLPARETDWLFERTAWAAAAHASVQLHGPSVIDGLGVA